MPRKRSAQSPEYTVSDEAAAYIADALMEIALQFEASHFAEIRRHYDSITPLHDYDPWQLDLFSKLRRSDAGLFLRPFFSSTRAASILPSRPPNRTAVARRACQGWPRLRGHPKGLALTGPSTAARSIGSGLEAAGNCRDGACWSFSPLPVAHPRQPIRGSTLASRMLAAALARYMEIQTAGFKGNSHRW